MSNVIYIGGQLTKDGVMPNELFTDKPVELIERLKEKYPLIEFLFVPVETYSEAVKERDTAGTVYATAYAQTKRHV